MRKIDAYEALSPADEATVTAQLGRVPRGVVGVAHRCPCGRPDVVATRPRLPGGEPFPTTFYLTCPRATAACSTQESQGRMAQMAERLGNDPALAAAYAAAHADYLARRRAIGRATGDGDVPEIDAVSAGGMSERVKCLHALVAHALAAGPGTNPFGDETLAEIGRYWQRPCLEDQQRVETTMSDTVAAIDCGTNSIRLLLAGPGQDGDALTDRGRQSEVVRLGQGVDATGEFHPDALARTFAVTERYAEAVRAAGVPAQRTRFVATSAARDAGNREEFFAGIEQRLGVRPEIISGDEEARLSFAGALSRVRPEAEAVLVVDIGGGSTELIVGSAAGELASAVSLDVGSVRLTERFLKTSPPDPAGLDQATRHIDDLLDTSGVDFASVGTWIGVAGTATTLAGVHLQLEAYDRAQVHGTTIGQRALTDLLTLLCRMSVEQIRALPSMHPGRADVVTAGTLIATRIGARLGVSGMLVSESDILDGLALQLLRRA